MLSIPEAAKIYPCNHLCVGMSCRCNQRCELAIPEKGYFSSRRLHEHFQAAILIA